MGFKLYSYSQYLHICSKTSSPTSYPSATYFHVFYLTHVAYVHDYMHNYILI